MSAAIRGCLTLPIYDSVKRTYSSDQGSGIVAKFNQRMGAAFISSVLISLLLYPLDTIKRCL